MIAAAAILMTAPPANAAPAKPLPSPRINVGYDPGGTAELNVAGSGCVDSSGKVGTVTLTYTKPGQASETFTLPTGWYDGVGGWRVGIGLKTAVITPGKYSLAATCDLYSSESAYTLVSTLYASKPTATSKPTSVVPGQNFQIEVTGFPPNSSLIAYWQNGKIRGTGAFADIGYGFTDSNGTDTLGVLMDPSRLQAPISQWLGNLESLGGDGRWLGRRGHVGNTAQCSARRVPCISCGICDQQWNTCQHWH